MLLPAVKGVTKRLPVQPRKGTVFSWFFFPPTPLCSYCLVLINPLFTCIVPVYIASCAYLAFFLACFVKGGSVETLFPVAYAGIST